MHTFSKRSAVALITAFFVPSRYPALLRSKNSRRSLYRRQMALPYRHRTGEIRMGRKSCSSTASRKVIYLGSSRSLTATSQRNSTW